ncbi:MAG: tRNA dihydrouridine(20/20a) synthase DusA [Rhodospirillaceae bacterium]|nr:tRNA dihydrouridine(20/20a) synthase DusA [Rhodospirillaceae bacterium]
MATSSAHRLTHRFGVAPMMDCTDRHYRFLARLISRRARLYTEMVTAAAIVRGKDPERFLGFDGPQLPLTLQLGGSDPAELAKAARMAEDFGYDELNLNVGCPSDRVTSGRFGACLMAEPALVADCIGAMIAAVKIPVTVKTRTGIATKAERHVACPGKVGAGFPSGQAPKHVAKPDMLDPLVEAVAATGCDTFVIHARNAWLEGLSPKENREIPPLDYARVRRLKADRPDLAIVLNGGLKTLAASHQESAGLDGVMLGRAAYEQPYMLADVDRQFYGDETPPLSRAAAVEAYAHYAAGYIAPNGSRGGLRPSALYRHLSGLFHGGVGARRWRQQVSKACQGEISGADLARLATALDRPEVLAA